MLSILIVDSCKISTVMTAELFKEKVSGTTVTLANNAKECLTYLQEELYDIIIIDLNLPDLDGISLIRKIKKDFSVPTFLTAYPVTSILKTIKEKLFIYHDASKWIPKPIRPKELEKRVLYMTNKRLRLYTRFEVNLEARLTQLDDEFTGTENTCTIQNLSLKGALLTFSKKNYLKKEDQGNILIDLCGKKYKRKSSSKKLRLKFRTIWVHKKNKIAGLFFPSINDRQQTLLEEYLKKKKEIIGDNPLFLNQAKRNTSIREV